MYVTPLILKLKPRVNLTLDYELRVLGMLRDLLTGDLPLNEAKIRKGNGSPLHPDSLLQLNRKHRERGWNLPLIHTDSNVMSQICMVVYTYMPMVHAHTHTHSHTYTGSVDII